MKKLILALFTLIILVLLGAGGLFYWMNNVMFTKIAHGKSNQYIQIPKGSTPNEIVDKLAAEGIINNAFVVKNYIRFLGDGSKIKAGEYQFDSPISPIMVLQELEKGEERTSKLTIPEGFTRFDIAKRLAEKFPQTPPMDDKAVLALMDDTSLIKDIDPTAKNLEGFMYPSTYSFPKDVKMQDVIKKMVEQFKKIWTADRFLKAQQMGKSAHEIITIASLIETESKFDGERQIVASVIYNRLNKGIALGIDQTAVYIAKMEGRWDGTINKSDLESNSPYNTRKFAGLPPGPISSISESSIDAALNPKQTDYIFYVLNVEKNDGSHNFYSSAAEFEKGKAAYQVWLEQQRAKKREENGNN
ncbi:MAG TPA: endolytic transglycosylase MltG [Pyrinomonadaceae bacterium]|nr:endolytic transglycosylase MltG [Pyrinomonadaceae bacterium]